MARGGPIDREGAGRRRAPRVLEPLGVLCDKGAVGDISLSGVRVLARCRWPEGHHDVLTLSDATRRLRTEVMCVWCRESDGGGHSVGLCFSGLSEAEAALLEAMLDEARSRQVAA